MIRIIPLNIITFLQKILDNEIDGEALRTLTERALELLIPVIGKRMKFLKLIEEIKKKDVQCKEVEAVILDDKDQDVNDGASTSRDTQEGQEQNDLSPPVTPEVARFVFLLFSNTLRRREGGD